MVVLKRQLYQCLNAKCQPNKIYCSKGYHLAQTSYEGTIPLVRLARGFPLEQTACQDCPDYDEMGSPLFQEDRGWVTMKATGRKKRR